MDLLHLLFPEEDTSLTLGSDIDPSESQYLVSLLREGFYGMASVTVHPLADVTARTSPAGRRLFVAVVVNENHKIVLNGSDLVFLKEHVDEGSAIFHLGRIVRL